MRNIRARRRFRLVLILLLVITALTFFESRIEAFAPQFKTLAELKIEEVCGNRIDISIGRLDGGVLRPFSLRDVDVTGKSGKGAPRFVEINSIVSNYRIWNFIFPKFLSSEPYVAIDFTTKNHELSGFVTLEGSVANASIKGYLRLFDGEKIEITGKMKNGIVHLILTPKSGLIKVEGNFAADGVVILKMSVNHLKLRTLDISGEATIKNISMKDGRDKGEDYAEGEIEFKNLILNYRPFLDGKASYRVSKDVLEISNFYLGKSFYINGKFGLREPHLIDAIVLTDNANLGEMLSTFNGCYSSFVNGIMNSKWEFKGPAGNLKSKIHLEVRQGEISGVKFKFLNADLKGDGPVVRIEDSRITLEGSSVALAGDMDLRKIGKDSFFEGIKVTDGKDTMVWDGYETSKWQDAREFKMSKNIVGDINVGFKKFINDEKVDESLRDKDEFELSYSLHPTDSIKVKFSDKTNYFGLEHKDKF